MTVPEAAGEEIISHSFPGRRGPLGPPTETPPVSSDAHFPPDVNVFETRV